MIPLRRILCLCGCAALIPACSRSRPPAAKAEPHRLEMHGHVRTDGYYWLRDRENPEVIRYLEAENAYVAAAMAHTAELQETLVREFKERIPQTDVSAPYRKEGYFYYKRDVAGQDYPVHCRKKGSLEAPEEVILDVNEVAAGHVFCSVGELQVSPGHDLMAYPVDTGGRRFYTIRVKNLRTGEHLPDVIADVTSNLAWAADNRTFFYAKQDPVTLRSWRIFRHELGTDPANDELVFEEKDDTFRCHVFRTKSDKYIMIASQQTLSSEFRYLDAGTPRGSFQVFLPRRRDHEYELDHYKDHFFIRTNLDARNFRLMKTSVGRNEVENWREVIAHREDALLDGFELFKDHLVVSERKEGLRRLRVIPWSGTGEYDIDFGEPAYTASLTDNYEVNTTVVRYAYSSLATPPSVYDYDMTRREKKLVKRDEIGGGFDPANYRTERIWAPARDGARIPISVVYRAPFERDGTRALLQRGYGSYGNSTEPAFDSYAISLLDRGFVYAIAHIRGGQELGRAWYEDGKLLKKKNTFTDFIDSAEHLVRQKYVDPRRTFAWGGSAGGLLMGAVMTMRPDLFTGIVAEVPFVDVVTTMLDDSIPLTTNEYDEWGNPNDKQYYDYMLSYSPYDQTAPARYPNLLVTTGLNDSQVQYWEPAKWVARLRAVKQDDNLLLLKTEMQSGHGGLSARDDRYRERAFRYSFLLDRAGIKR
ncbi:MAG: S9 family peptidase [Bryobacteraceae bacterium]|nr:S9 family peptidase [Bryobacteraceae bacterium]